MRILKSILVMAIYLHSLEACEYSISHFSSKIKEDDFISQADQDRFVYYLLYCLMDKQDKGYYLEIGSGEPDRINNSFFFEKNLQWDGVSIDISKVFFERWYSLRKNLLLSEDATQSDYSAILNGFPQVIDYLSLDIDQSYDVVLERLLRSDVIFKIITIEHDFYRYGDVYRKRERQILSDRSYYLLCPDVAMNGLAFEDWWVHPSFFPSNLLSSLTSLDLSSKNYAEITQAIRTAFLDK